MKKTGKFLTKLEVEQLSDDEANLWKLTNRLTYITSDGTVIVVPKGFITDFASVPRLPLIYAFVGNISQTAATLHDYLYRIDALPYVSRSLADQIFREASEVRNVGFFRRWTMWLGVKIGGGISYKTKKLWEKP